jgi:hypothetical protein
MGVAAILFALLALCMLLVGVQARSGPSISPSAFRKTLDSTHD